MNILIYNQERRECTMQNKISIYKSINKQKHIIEDGFVL